MSLGVFVGILAITGVVATGFVLSKKAKADTRPPPIQIRPPPIQIIDAQPVSLDGPVLLLT